MIVSIAGDFCPLYGVSDLIEKGKYEEVLGEVQPILKESNFSIVNLECPILNNEDCKPILKKGPNLRTSEAAVDALQYAGFGAVTLANNHFRDYGDEGCMSTLSTLDSHSILHVGGGKNICEAQQPLIVTIDKRKLCIINLCEHEFSIATEHRYGAAPLDLIDVHREILKAREVSDYIIVITHCGHENFNLPSMTMKKNFRWFVEMGADAVINHHQHCYSGYEIYKNKPIFYGIGNFCFPRLRIATPLWNSGYIVKLSLDLDVSFEIIPYLQCNGDKSIKLLDDDQIVEFEKDLKKINDILADEEQHRNCVYDYYKKCGQDIGIMLGNNSDNRVLRGLKRKGLLPNKLTSEKCKTLYDYINCESHRDKVLYYLGIQLNRE